VRPLGYGTSKRVLAGWVKLNRSQRTWIVAQSLVHWKFIEARGLSAPFSAHPPAVSRFGRRCTLDPVANCGCWLGSAALPIVSHYLRFAVQICSLQAGCSHLPDLRCLLFEACSESFNFLLLLRDGLHLAVLFEELVKQHRVHRLITHGDNHPLVIASHEIGVDLFHLLGHQANEDARRG
jgi:hypothetical protein